MAALTANSLGSVLPNTHGGVTFPTSPARLASLVTRFIPRASPCVPSFGLSQLPHEALGQRLLLVVPRHRLVEAHRGVASIYMERCDLVVEAGAVQLAPADARVLGARCLRQGGGDA